MIILAHTHIRNNFVTILDSEEEWRNVCRSLERLRERPQSSAYARAAATRTSALSAPPWYLRHLYMAAWFDIASFPVFCLISPILQTGRDRFWSVCLSVVLGCLSLYWARQGPSHLRCPPWISWLFRSSSGATVQIDADDDDDGDRFDDSTHTPRLQMLKEVPKLGACLT